LSAFSFSKLLPSVKFAEDKVLVIPHPHLNDQQQNKITYSRSACE